MGYRGAVAGESGVEARREKRINRCCGRIIADTSSGLTKTRTCRRGKGTCASGGNAFREISKMDRVIGSKADRTMDFDSRSCHRG